MRSKIAMTVTLLKGSVDVLRRDKEMLLLALCSIGSCLGLLYLFIRVGNEAREAGSALTGLHAAYVFLYFFLGYFVVTFFNAAIMGAAYIRLTGGNPTIGNALILAIDRLPWISGWALISASVTLIFQHLEGKGFRVLGFLAEVSWALATYLVVPMIIVERRTPISAIRESAALIKKTWGDQATSHIGFGLFEAVLIVPAAVLVFVSNSDDLLGTAARFWYISLITYATFVFTVTTTLRSIFNMALYCRVKEIDTGNELLPGIAYSAIDR